MRLIKLAGAVFALMATVAARGQGATSSPPRAQPAAAQPAVNQQSPAAIALNQTMRKLWEEQVAWTRRYLVPALAGLPDAQVSAARLRRHQDDIGNAIQPCYGAAAGDQLVTLLRTHITHAADPVAATRGVTRPLWVRPRTPAQVEQIEYLRGAQTTSRSMGRSMV